MLVQIINMISERQAIYDLKRDQNIIILPADKGKITVVLDIETYESKVSDLLSDEPNYQRTLPRGIKINC